MQGDQMIIMKQTTKLFLLFFACFFLNVGLSAQDCPDHISGIIWEGKNSSISFVELAAHGAPMLWFSPNENDLITGEKRHLPDHFPFDKYENPVVYYKIRYIYTEDKSKTVKKTGQSTIDSLEINLEIVKAIDLDYYYYFENEYGLGKHKHDIESISLQLRIETAPDTCTNYEPYTIYVKRVIGRAHGLHWYDNILEVDEQTHFPISVLIEEGKHASCPDKDANGVFIPGFDITEHIHDSWGVRDIISSGRLISSGFNSWMAKKREKENIYFPPLPKTSPNNNEDYKTKFGDFFDGKIYQLQPYPKYPEGLENAPDGIEDKIGLDDKMKNKKPHQWPEKKRVRLDGVVKQWMKQEKPFRPISFAYRWDESHGISIAFPLLLFKNVEAPITGGWLYNKVSAGIWNSDITENALDLNKLVEHQILYSTSASRWAEPYIGLGYGFFDEYTPRNENHYEFHMVSEVGLKFRFRIFNLFMGLRLGWKNVGLDSFRDGGMVLEFGSGVF